MTSIVTNTSESALVESGWLKLPVEYRMPSTMPTLEQARAYCQRLAESHYENFTVVSWFLPKRLRKHFHAIYAYCRISDDLGDEVGNREESLALLDFWQRQLDACYRGEAAHPVFVALSATIRECNIPQQPFNDLLTAFRQDQDIHRFATMDDILGYCHYSANPVGHLVLYTCGYSDAERMRLSDFTCSALQFANFWQDVSVDLEKDRMYLPEDDREKYGVTEEALFARRADDNYRKLVAFQVARTQGIFDQGAPLTKKLRGLLRLEIRLTWLGGTTILRKIEALNFDTLNHRPTVGKADMARLFFKALIS